MRLRVLNAENLIILALFLLALIPRLPDLGRFLTADEFLWVDRSRNFLAGMLDPAYRCTTVVEKWEFAQGLACTLRTGHPGVTTMWTGSLGLGLSWLYQGTDLSLFDYLLQLSTNPLEASLIAPARLGTVIITSFWVVLVYGLSRRLFGRPVALAGALLLALDPFVIAHSRVIHHDALSTTFMTLSVFTAWLYWGEGGETPGPEGRNQNTWTGYFYHRRWLLLSGGLAGLGFLSKSAAMYLMPYIALVGLWFTLKRTGLPGRAALPVRPLLHTVFDGLLWFAAAVLAFWATWPAMWVIPLEALDTVFFIGSKYATGGHAKGNYLLGEVSQDPGPLFYPVTWLYRVSPLVLLGIFVVLIAWLGFILANRKSQPERGRQAGESLRPYRSFFQYLPLILIFILGYYLLVTVVEKKQERYFLPAYPWTDLMAGAGLVVLADYLRWYLVPATRRSPLAGLRSQGTALLLLLGIIGGVNGYFLVAHFPYYFTYYNPLLGGIQGAAKAVTIGWGEGLDLAAEHLNRRVDPAQTRVASWYESTFAPFYDGPAISYSKEKGKALAGDYVVFYINQTQRRFPDDVLFDYYAQRFHPEVITLKGLEYAWIYPSLGIDHYGPDQFYTGIAALLAWQWKEGDTSLTPGQTVDFELYWEYLGKDRDEPFFFRLVDAQGRPWAEGLSHLVTDRNPPVEQWREGEIIYEAGQLALPASMPPGQYQLQIGFYTKAPAVTSGELLFELLPEEALVTISRAAPSTFTAPASATAVAHSLGSSLTLLAAEWPQEPLAPEAEIPLELYWRVEQPLQADAGLHIGLMNEAGEAKQAWFNLTLAETFNPTETTWQPGDIIQTRWQLQLLPQVEPGRYRLELVLPDDPGQILAVGELVIEPQ